jgi:Ca2+-binding EF-hand superfamily protein
MVIIVVQCHIDCTKEEVLRLIEHLPKDSKGRVTIDDFCRTPILSEEVFRLMDKVPVTEINDLERV